MLSDILIRFLFLKILEQINKNGYTDKTNQIIFKEISMYASERSGRELEIFIIIFIYNAIANHYKQ